MNRLLQASENLFRIEELGERVLFTMALWTCLYSWCATMKTTEKIDQTARVRTRIFAAAQGNALGIFRTCSAGGQLRRFDDFCLGHMPTSPPIIICKVMTDGVPYLER